MDKKQKALLKKMIPVTRIKERAHRQMTLGSLIKALQRERVGLFVDINSNEAYPGLPHSYYGHPSDLAFEPGKTPITVAEFLKVCDTAMKSSFTGPDHASDYYRDYIMQANTPVWISKLDIASKTGIVDVVPTNGYITLVTKITEEEQEEKDGSE